MLIMSEDHEIITSLIHKDLELDNPDVADEQELLSAIIQRVTWMIEYDMDLLMSYLYRLDIIESDINKALMPGSPLSAAESLGILILKRQKERVASKKKYKQAPIKGWEF